MPLPWRMRAWTLLIATALAARPAWPANPNSAGAAAPYEVQVVLHFADDPRFTRLYKEAVFNQARDHLLALMDGVFRTEVVTEHVLVDRLAVQPLEELSLSHAEAAALQQTGQVYLVTVEYVDGTYRIGSRRYDGPRGLLGPYRRSETPDRQWVPKAVCDAVRRQLALEAEVRPSERTRDEVYLRFPAGLSLETIEHWLPRGTVFQVMRVEEHPDGSRKQSPLPNTVLRLQPPTSPDHQAKRFLTARVVSNMRDPWRSSSRNVRFIALNLPVRTGRLRLRLLDQATGEPAYGATLQVRVSDRGFDQLTDGSLLELDPEGYVTTPPLAGLAYVQIWQAGQVAFEFPVPILDEWTEVERRIPVDAQGREKAEFQRLLDYQTRDLRLLHENLNAAMRHLNSLNEAKRYEEACDACAALLREFRSSGRAVSSRLTELEKLATSLGLQDQPRLRQVSDDAKKLQGRVSDLANLHESLQRTIEKAEAQARADVLIELGKQALDAYEIDDAIDKFKLALIEQPDQPELKQQLEALEETWRVKSSQHRAARELVFEAWAHAELTELEEMLPKVRQAAQTLLRYKDHLSLGRLLHANTEHIVAISELIDELANRGTTEDQQEGGKWADVSETLDNFNQELTGYIDSLTNSGSPDDPARPVQPDAAAAKQPDQDAVPSTPSSQPTSTSPPDGSPPAGKAAEDEEEE